MNELFYCKSLNLVAYIMSKGIKPQGINTRGSNATFYFIKDEKLKNIINTYNQNQELKDFIASFKRVKEIIKETKSN